MQAPARQCPYQNAQADTGWASAESMIRSQTEKVGGSAKPVYCEPETSNHFRRRPDNMIIAMASKAKLRADGSGTCSRK